MTEFDPLRAAKEELQSMLDIMSSLARREGVIESQLSSLESEIVDVRKLRGFCQFHIDLLRGRIAALEEEKANEV